MRVFIFILFFTFMRFFNSVQSMYQPPRRNYPVLYDNGLIRGQLINGRIVPLVEREFGSGSEPRHRPPPEAVELPKGGIMYRGSNPFGDVIAKEIYERHATGPNGLHLKLRCFYHGDLVIFGGAPVAIYDKNFGDFRKFIQQ